VRVVQGKGGVEVRRALSLCSASSFLAVRPLKSLVYPLDDAPAASSTAPTPSAKSPSLSVLPARISLSRTATNGCSLTTLARYSTSTNSASYLLFPLVERSPTFFPSFSFFLSSLIVFPRFSATNRHQHLIHSLPTSSTYAPRSPTTTGSTPAGWTNSSGSAQPTTPSPSPSLQHLTSAGTCWAEKSG
jgi:hypothetical protein